MTAPPTSNTTGAPNQVTSYSYDLADETTSITTGTGTSAASATSYCFDPDGNKTAAVAPDGNTSGTATCATSSPWQTTSSYQTGYVYDSLAEVTSVSRPATSAAPSGQTTSFTYDPAGNVLTSVDPKSITATNTYTPLGEVATTSYSGSSAPSVSYGYDADGNRVSMSDGTGSSSYSYDIFDELASYTNANSKTVAYTYDTDGNTTGITYPLGSPGWAATSTVSYGYDAADQLTSLTDFNNHTTTITNTADGLPHTAALGATGDTLTTTYDPAELPSTISLTTGSTTLQSFTYSDLPSSQIGSETTTPTTTYTPAAFSYDAQGRVTQMTPGSHSNLNYTFDASGNPTTLPTGATGSYDNASELTSSTLSGTTTTYTYDADGQRLQTTIGGSTLATAAYNGANTLTSYSNSAANLSSASYDGDNLRQTATSTPSGGSATTQHFTWDISSTTPQLLQDSTNAYIYGPNATPLEQVTLSSGTATYLIADRLGSVRGTINTSGTLTGTTSYDAWGNPQTTGGLTSTTPLGYAGGYTDQTGLLYLVHRYYDPTSGQFLTVDPLVDLGGANYAYANDNPINSTDPSGALSITGALKVIHDVTGVIAFGATTCAVVAAPTAETGIGAAVAAFCGAVAVQATALNAGTAVILNSLGKESTLTTGLDILGFFGAGYSGELGKLAEEAGSLSQGVDAASEASALRAASAARSGQLGAAIVLSVQAEQLALESRLLEQIALNAGRDERLLDRFSLAVAAYEQACL